MCFFLSCYHWVGTKSVRVVVCLWFALWYEQKFSRTEVSVTPLTMLFSWQYRTFLLFHWKKSLFKCCSFSLHWFYSSFHTKEDSPSRAGEVLVSLCYLPTTNRLTFVVLKARLSKTSFPNDLPREYNLYFSWKKISVWFKRVVFSAVRAR